MISETISHYRIINKLGAGGMGEVYLAEDTLLDRKVAIKFLPPESTADEQAKKRLIREAKAAAKLDHPNICAIHEVSEEGGRAFIVMQYVEGETLASRIHRKSITESLDVAAQVADALSEAHSRGIVHRDIKPQNVMITGRGQVKLMDFGLARAVQPTSLTESQAETQSLLTEPGMIVGTVPYMSPEQVRGKLVDARSDIFSFGAVLYEMITGRQPFAAESAAATFSAILTREPPPLARYTEEAPAEMQRIIRKCLEKDAEERYQSARDLLIDLRNLKRESESGFLTRARVPPQARSNLRYIAYPALAFLALAMAGIVVYLLNSASKPIDSLAVLPFVNSGADPDTEYLSDGITDSLINSLSQLSHLSVKARSSVFRYKGKEVEAQKVAAALSVRAILYGRVTQRGDDLTLSLSLVDGRTGNQLWGEQYQRKLTDLVTLQNGIARDVLQKLRGRLSGAEEQRLTRSSAENAEAYQLYLKGLYEWNKHTQTDYQKSIEYYRQALDKDPNYALAYFGLAASYSALGNNYLPAHDVYPIAKEYAAKALALDDTLAQAHHATGAMKLFYDWDWGEAEKEFKRAQSLDPNFARSHQLYGDYFEIMGRFDEAKAERKRALELDPLSPAQNMVDGATFYFARQYDEAIAQLEKTIYLEPHYYPAYQWLAQAYEQKKMYTQAIETLQKGMAQAERNPQLIAPLAHAYALAGEPDQALKILAELREQSKQRYISPYLIAVVYVGLGDQEQAVGWLEKAYQDRSYLLIWLKVEPLFDALRSDARFQDLLRRIGLLQ